MYIKKQKRQLDISHNTINSQAQQLSLNASQMEEDPIHDAKYTWLIFSYMMFPTP